MCRERDIREYLHGLRMIDNMRDQTVDKWHYKSMADLVLREGDVWCSHELPKTVKKGPIKNCFNNCANLVLEHEDFVYCEGFACGIIPCHHAWCLDAASNVVDPTWPYAEEDVYYGLVIPREMLRKAMQDRRWFSVLDNWENGHPLYRKPWVESRACAEAKKMTNRSPRQPAVYWKDIPVAHRLTTPIKCQYQRRCNMAARPWLNGAGNRGMYLQCTQRGGETGICGVHTRVIHALGLSSWEEECARFNIRVEAKEND